MAKQFRNAFIRQLGRETAHEFYNTVTSAQSTTDEGKELKPGIPDKLNYTWLFILDIFVPLGCVITLIQGLVRLLSGKIRYYYEDTVYMSVADKRYRHGRRSAGSYIDKRYVKLDKNSVDQNIVKEYEKHALYYIGISVTFIVLAFFFWPWFISLGA